MCGQKLGSRDDGNKGSVDGTVRYNPFNLKMLTGQKKLMC